MKENQDQDQVQDQVQESRQQQMRQQQMASFGCLLADFSHEMRNHLAVIQEANGLLEDMLAMKGTAGNSLLTSLEESSGQIRKRVRSAGELCQNLSRMAHRSDTPCSFFQVNELIRELVALLVRSARSQQVSLELELGQEIEPIFNEPALLQYVLYQLYVFLLGLVNRGQVMIIRTAQVEKGVTIDLYVVDDAKVEVSALPETVLAACASLEARLETLARAGKSGVHACGFQLLIPSLSRIE